MLKIEIDKTAFQSFLIPFEGENIDITLNFRSGYWFMDLKYKDKEVYGLKLSSAVLMLQGMNLPFDIIIDDKGNGLDPFSVDCFELSIFDFYVLEREDMKTIRGFEVE